MKHVTRRDVSHREERTQQRGATGLHATSVSKQTGRSTAQIQKAFSIQMLCVDNWSGLSTMEHELNARHEVLV